MSATRKRRPDASRRLWLTLALAIFLPALVVATPAESPVADAAMAGDVDAVRALLRQAADVNAAQADGMTALHWAAENDAAELAEMLIYAGANLEAGTRMGAYRPLHLASKAGNRQVVRVLLEAGSDIDAATTAGGANPLHFAAATGNVEVVAMLLDHGADIDTLESAWGQTPLMFAVANNRLSVVNALLERGADAAIATKVVDIVAAGNELRDEEQLRRASRAALRKVEEEAAARAAEAEGDAEPAEDEAGEAETEGEETNESGEPGEPAEEPSEQPAPAAEVDAEAEPAATPEASEGEPTDEDDDGGLTEEELMLMQQRRSFPGLVFAQGGLTALHFAARDGHAGVALALLDHDVDVNPVTGDDTSPLLIAAINGQYDLAMTLLEYGADPNLASEANGTAVYAAINAQYPAKTSYPQQTAYKNQETTHAELIAALLEAGADPNVRLNKKLWYQAYNFDQQSDTTGATPFWRAAQALDVEVMRLLVAHGADPNVPTRKIPRRRYRRGRTKEIDHSRLPPVKIGGPAIYPLHIASGAGYAEGTGFAANHHRHMPDGWMPAVRYLVEELGADVNTRDDKGYSPLHHAAGRGDNEMVVYLYMKGADPLLLSRRGQTIADMANGPMQRVRPYPATMALAESLGSENHHNCISC